MGTCCGVHLTLKVRNYASNSQDGSVTVRVQSTAKCDYCDAPGEFIVSYSPK